MAPDLIENAYVKGASRAHSGPFGIVNSEEGYQNLTRFLFGNIRFEVLLEPLEITRDFPKLGKGEGLYYLLLELDIVLRGLPAYVQTRREESRGGIIIRMRHKPDGSGYKQENPNPTPLSTGFLRLDKKMKGDSRLHVGVHVDDKASKVEFHWGTFASNKGKKPNRMGPIFSHSSR
jgi:hypothetical protein